MSRAVASLCLSLASVVLLGLIVHGTLALFGAILALVLAFAGAFAGFVAYEGGAPVAQRYCARAGAVIGCVALLVGSALFLRAIVMP